VDFGPILRVKTLAELLSADIMVHMSKNYMVCFSFPAGIGLNTLLLRRQAR